MNSENLAEKLEACLIAAAWIREETQVIDTSELFQLFNPAVPYGHMNGIYRTRFGSDAGSRIQKIYQQYREAKIAFRWYVFPCSQPADLDSRLGKLKAPKVTELLGLQMPTASENFVTPTGVTVEPWSADNLDEYAATSNAGWGQVGDSAERIRLQMREDFFGGKVKYRSYLARYKGAPAATGLIMVVNGAGYFFGGSTRPEFRGKGVYRGLIAERLRILKNEGIPVAMVMAIANTSAPIFLRLGFKEFCTVRSHDFEF